MNSTYSARTFGALLFVGILALSSACGPNYKNRAVVKGKVTTGGTALTTGTVVFHGKDNITASAVIDKDGNYVMNDAPVGDVSITVTVPQPPPGGVEKMRNSPAFKGQDGTDSSAKGITIMGDNVPENVVPISDRYPKLESSTLKYKVEKGEHTYNIELIPCKPRP